jgi:2-amino-4-hydroxy-6-hydroxymethyldihydropteridine diphosphokinase
MLQKVVLGFGSNIGNRQKYILDSIKMLSIKRNFLFIGLSGLYESEPWGFKNQNNFLNCVAVFLYRSGPGELLAEIKKVEKKTGRTIRKKWHPREIDIDILFFNNKVLNKKSLMIPHPRLEFRNFVLAPLVQLIPQFVHPSSRITINTLFNNSADLCRVSRYK